MSIRKKQVVEMIFDDGLLYYVHIAGQNIAQAKMRTFAYLSVKNRMCSNDWVPFKPCPKMYLGGYRVNHFI